MVFRCLLVLLTACGDDRADLLGGGRTVHHSSGDDDDDATTTDGTDPKKNGTTPTAADAKALFDGLSADLTTKCGNACHTEGSGGAPKWLAGPDPHATAVAYPGIVVESPDASIIVTKPAHEGPALSDALKTKVKAWIAAEYAAQNASGTAGPATTADVPVAAGAGSVDLPSPGGKITFTATVTGSVLSLKQLSIVAPAASGIHVQGVHLQITHADKSTAMNDSLSGADTTAGPGQTTVLGIGTLIAPGIASGDKMAFVLDKLEGATAAPDGGTTTGGCVALAMFTSNVVPQLQSNTCLNCHNTGGSGFGSLDLSALTSDPAKACAQSKSKADTANPANSPIITAPTGGIAAHPYKNASAAYRTALTNWITAEK